VALDYSAYVHADALDVLQRTSKAEASKAIRWIRQLCQHPFQRGDFTEKDPSGRELEVTVVGRLAVYHWADHAVREVKIVRVRPAD
jgi:hypothetical protein